MPGVQLFAGSLKAGLQRVSVPGGWIVTDFSDARTD